MENKTLEYLEWALDLINANYQETGKIEMAEALIWKAAKRHCEELHRQQREPTNVAI